MKHYSAQVLKVSATENVVPAAGRVTLHTDGERLLFTKEDGSTGALYVNSGVTGLSGITGQDGAQGLLGGTGLLGHTGLYYTGTYTHVFQDSDLVGGLLTIPHNLGTQAVAITVLNQNRQEVMPSVESLIDDNRAELDIEVYRPLQGVWTAVVSAANGTNSYRLGTGVSGVSVLNKSTAGVAGQTGAPGLAASNGVQGITGLSGVSGAQGLTGAPGINGSIGSNGVQGATGLPGLSGVTGPAGLSVDKAALKWELGKAPVSADWYSVCYGNGLFVAIARNSNYIGTSPDGITWTLRTAPASAEWRSVCYGNGLYVAIAYGSNKIITSSDGITWTSRTAPTTANWQTVCYGNGLFVAVSNGSSIAISSDGRVWALSPYSPDSVSWHPFCYGNGLFVAVAYNRTYIMTSSDGITWASSIGPLAAGWYSICYGNGLFVAVASGGTNIMTSPDGVTWTLRTAPASTTWQSVCYGNGLFVAVAYNSTNIMTSVDGITWTLRNAPSLGNWYPVCYGNGLFVAVASNSTNIMTQGIYTGRPRQALLEYIPLSTSGTAVTWEACKTPTLLLTSNLTAATTVTIQNQAAGYTNHISFSTGATAYTLTLSCTGVTFVRGGTTTTGSGSLALSWLTTANANYVVILRWASATVCYVGTPS